MAPTFKHPSAWIPIALSLLFAVAEILMLISSGAPARQPDEGVMAHLFQLWLVLELVMVAWFAIAWLPRAPTQAIRILLFQLAMIMAVCTPVFYFHL